MKQVGVKNMRGTLNHVEIYVRDLKVTREFWKWLLLKLGYREHLSLEEGVISYILGETYIVFVQTQERFLDIPYHRCRVGLNHLAFHGDGREFVDEITEELREKGVKILYKDRHPYAGGPNYYAVFFEDPDRIKVEITAH
jgi:catechol 2,3-dioxygenase-like lactoylglutathione lyase family enzyme